MGSSRLALGARTLALLFGACVSSCIAAAPEERLPPDSGPAVGGSGEVAVWHGDAAVDPADAAEPSPDGG